MRPYAWGHDDLCQEHQISVVHSIPARNEVTTPFLLISQYMWCVTVFDMVDEPEVVLIGVWMRLALVVKLKLRWNELSEERCVNLVYISHFSLVFFCSNQQFSLDQSAYCHPCVGCFASSVIWNWGSVEASDRRESITTPSAPTSTTIDQSGSSPLWTITGGI